MSGAADKTVLLADLRARIRRLEGGGCEATGERVRFGLSELDAAFPGGGLPLGCVHEILPARPGDEAAAGGFAAALLAGLARAGRVGSVLWISGERDLYIPGMAGFGLGPERLLHLRLRRAAEMLWAMEEGLRCRSLGGVVGELTAIDLTASRRLQLAAEAGGVTGFLLMPATAAAVSAAVSRWRIAALPARSEAGDPGPGKPCWAADLVRCRGGRPGGWRLEWSGAGLCPAGAGNPPGTDCPAGTASAAGGSRR